MATTSFNVKFYINYGGVHIPGMLIEDTTDYAGQGLAPANLNGNIKLTSPSGVVVHNNTDFTDGGCDMPQTAALSNPTILLPTLPNGSVQLGSYTVLYTVYNKVTIEYYTVERVVNFNYVRPKLILENTVDYELNLFVSNDKTNYEVNGVSPAISFYDHNLYFPHGSAGEDDPILTTNLLIQSPVFYPGTQSATVQSVSQWVFDTTAGSTFNVYDTVAGTVDTVVSSNDLCDVYCCLRSLYERMVQAKCSNSKNHSELRALFNEATGIATLAMIAKNCGETNDIPGYISQIKDILNCSDCDDCN